KAAHQAGELRFEPPSGRSTAFLPMPHSASISSDTPRLSNAARNSFTRFTTRSGSHSTVNWACRSGRSGDGTLKVWDAATGQETLTLKGHTGEVMSVAFSPDGKRLASGSWDQTGQQGLTQGFIHKVDVNTGAVTNLAYNLAFAEGGAWDV